MLVASSRSRTRMSLREEFDVQGNWLFRRRSFLPVLGVPLLVLIFQHFSYPYGSQTLEVIWEMFCLWISLLGLAIRVYTTGCTPKRTSGRNTGKGQVADSLNTTGMYSVVRHPLYLGNFLMALGPTMFFRLWWVALLYVLGFCVYYERIMFGEEEFLRQEFGEVYLHWAAETAAFVPRFKKWRRPDLPFSWRTALKKEYQSLFAVIAVFFALEIIGDVVVDGHLDMEWVWCVLFIVGLAFYILVRVLRKRTKLLSVEGR